MIEQKREIERIMKERDEWEQSRQKMKVELNRWRNKYDGLQMDRQKVKQREKQRREGMEKMMRMMVVGMRREKEQIMEYL